MSSKCLISTPNVSGDGRRPKSGSKRLCGVLLTSKYHFQLKKDLQFYNHISVFVPNRQQRYEVRFQVLSVLSKKNILVSIVRDTLRIQCSRV